MLAKELVNIDFSPLQPASSISAALAKMDAWQSNSIPVVEPATRKNAGDILFEDISEIENGSLPVSEVELRHPIYVFENQHVFEVARLMLHHEIRLLPVVDNSETYLGILERRRVLEALSELLNVANEGSVITVEMAEADFTLSELIYLIEVEGARVLGLTVEHAVKDGAVVRVSMKLNQNNTSAVSSSLQRHGYISTTETKHDLLHADISSKADELMRYLDI